MNCELPDVHTGFRKGRGTIEQIANIRWIIEKAREYQKTIYLLMLHSASHSKKLLNLWAGLWEALVYSLLVRSL